MNVEDVLGEAPKEILWDSGLDQNECIRNYSTKRSLDFSFDFAQDKARDDKGKLISAFLITDQNIVVYQ